MATVNIDEPVYSFTEAALAAGVAPTTLRNWIDRNIILLDANVDREEGKWRLFSVLDILRIAFVSRLASYCGSVKVASELIEDTVISIAKHLRQFDNAPVGALRACYAPARFMVYHEGKECVIEFMPGSVIDSRFLKNICAGDANFLTVYPGPLVERIINNLSLEVEG